MNIKEILETTTQDISFPTPIGEVCLSVEKCRMNLLMQKYKAVVDSAREKFLSQCTAEPQNEEDLAEIQSIFADCKEDIYREMKKDIASIGAYNISDKNIDGLTVNMCWRFEAIMAALYDLLGEQRYSCSYRDLSETQVKTFRRVVGICVEDYISNVGSLAALRNSFRDFEFRLVMGLLVCVNHARHLEEDIDDTYNDILESAFGGSEEIEKCSQLLSNIKQNIIPEEQVEKILLYIAQTNPFSMELYTCIVQRCGDKDGEVQALADYLDFGDDVTAYKEEMIQSYFEELPMKTEEEALAAKEKLEAYCASLGYDGEEKEERQTGGIGPHLQERNADNRIPRNFHGLIVNQKASYAFTAPPLFNIGDKAANKQVMDALGDEYKKNCMELCVNAANCSIAWVHYWRGENGFEWVVVDSKEIIPVISRKLKKKLLGVFRIYPDVDETTGDNYMIYEYWTETECQAFHRRIGDSVDDGLSYYDMFVNPETGDPVSQYHHDMEEVPFIPFRNNNIDTDDLINIKPLIDVYDKVFSGFINDLDDIQELIFILRGYGGTELNGFMQDLKKYKVIKLDPDEDADAKTLSIEIPIEARNAVLEATRKAIFEQGQGFDPQPENFGNQSGEALKFMYAMLEMKTGLMQTEFETGFAKLVHAVCRFYNLQCDKIVQVWTRTSIKNDTEQAQICQQSVGIVSRKTILTSHPLVEDVEEELKQLAKEEEEAQEKAEQYGSAFGGAGNGSEENEDDVNGGKE